MEYWSEIEADFLSQYGVLNPLSLSWRKFLILVRGLKYDTAFVTAVRENSSSHRMEMLQRSIHGDDYNPHEQVTKRQVSADDLMRGT